MRRAGCSSPAGTARTYSIQAPSGPWKESFHHRVFPRLTHLVLELDVKLLVDGEDAELLVAGVPEDSAPAALVVCAGRQGEDGLVHWEVGHKDSPAALVAPLGIISDSVGDGDVEVELGVVGLVVVNHESIIVWVVDLALSVVGAEPALERKM